MAEKNSRKISTKGPVGEASMDVEGRIGSPSAPWSVHVLRADKRSILQAPAQTHWPQGKVTLAHLHFSRPSIKYLIHVS